MAVLTNDGKTTATKKYDQNMYSYHYYARAKMDSGNIADMDGIITTSKAITGNNDYKRLKQYLMKESKKDIRRITIISLTCLGKHQSG